MNIFSRCYYAISGGWEDGHNPIWSYLSKMYSFRDHRKVLFVCNFLIAIASVLFSAFAAWLAVLMYDPVYGSVWMGMMGLSILGAILTSVCIVGMRGAHLVSLSLLLTYFWGMIIFVGPLLLGVIACFDFYDYMFVWFNHQWEQPNFSGLHDLFCTKFITAGAGPDNVNAVAMCAAPLQNTDAWCAANFDGDTRCKDYREAAILEAVQWGSFLTLIQGIICIADLVLICGCLFLCFKIMKEQVITQSMNEVINYLLLLPIGACAGLAYYMWWLRDYDVQSLQYSWIAEGFAYIAGAQTLALPLGIIAGKLKSRNLLQLYIFLVFLLVGGLSANGAMAIVFAGILPQIFTPTVAQTNDLACGKELSGCCCCGEPDGANRCPEWSKSEVIQLLVLDLKISGIIAFASAVYLIGAFIVAFLVRRNLLNYKTEYVGMGKPLQVGGGDSSDGFTSGSTMTTGEGGHRIRQGSVSRMSTHGSASAKDDDNDDTLDGIELGSLAVSYNSNNSSPSTGSVNPFDAMNSIASRNSPDSNAGGGEIAGSSMTQADWERVGGRARAISSPSHATGLDTGLATEFLRSDLAKPPAQRDGGNTAIRSNSFTNIGNIRKTLPSYDIVNDGRSSSGESDDDDRNSSDKGSARALM